MSCVSLKTKTLVERVLLLSVVLTLLPAVCAAQSETLVEPQATFLVDPGATGSSMVAMSDDGRYLLFVSDTDSMVSSDSNGVADLFVLDKESNSLTLATIGPNDGQANIVPVEGSISGNGRVVVFSMEQGGFPPSGGKVTKQGVFLRDLDAGTTVYVAAGQNPSISYDGRYLVFESGFNDLISGDTNGATDVFIYDRESESIELVSKDSGGIQANGESNDGRISGDGARVAFSSTATNLINGDSNGVRDVFVRDMQSGAVQRVSVSSSDVEADADSNVCGISGDGSVVGFVSTASNISAADSSNAQLYLYFISTSRLELVSVDSSGAIGNGDSGTYLQGVDDTRYNCALSESGGFVAYHSKASNLVPGDTNNREDLFLRNTTVDRTSRMNVTSSGGQAEDDPRSQRFIDISADGRFVGYTSWADLESDGASSSYLGGYVTSIDPDVLDSRMRGLWNGYLGMVNILELVNKSPVNRSVRVVLRTISGGIAGEVNATLAPQTQRDFILNDLTGFTADSYGVVEVVERSQFGSISREGSLVGGALEARVFFYRPDGGSGYEFAYGLPFVNTLHGVSYVSFNTYQPSAYGADAANPVYNWLSIVNLSTAQTITFTVNRYSLSGQLLLSETYSVDPGGRRIDIDGGHGFGPSQVGYVEIVPNHMNQPYIAKTSRYGANAAGGFDFAFPLYAQKALDDTWIGISSGGGGQNWVEIQNVTDSPINVTVGAHAITGQQTASTSYRLSPRSGVHVEASQWVPNGLSGALEIVSDTPGSILTASMFYFRDSIGRIEAMYGTQGGETIGGVRWGTWNLFLGMNNWLRVFNVGTESESIRVTVYNGTQVVYDSTHPIQGRMGFDLGLHEVGVYGTNINNYGLVRVEADRVMTQLLRLRGAGGQGLYDFAAPTQVRR